MTVRVTTEKLQELQQILRGPISTLVIQRHDNEAVYITGPAKIIVRHERHRTRLIIMAPDSTAVLREELFPTDLNPIPTTQTPCRQSWATALAIALQADEYIDPDPLHPERMHLHALSIRYDRGERTLEGAD